MNRLLVLGAACAVLGGGLRIATSFIPYVSASPILEGLYFIVDISLLFALLAIYLREEATAGMGFPAASALAFIGLASIAGPDTVKFGIDFYQLGSMAFVVGLTFMSVTLLHRRQMKLSAFLWLGTAAATAVFVVTSSPLALTLAGVTLGGGFVLAGWPLRSSRVQ